jgi:hypothetical protein
MTRFTRSGNGKYVVHSKSYDMLIGTRAQVWHGTAFKTSGGLTKSHIMQNKNGRIVSRSKHSQAKKDNRLVRAGYGTKKGTFGFVKLSKGKSKRGGAPTMSATPTTAKAPTMSSTPTATKGSMGTTAPPTKGGAAAPTMPPMPKTSGTSSMGANTSMGATAKKGGKRGGAATGTMHGTTPTPTTPKPTTPAAPAASAPKMGATKGGRGRRRKGTRKMRGGMLALSPHAYSGKGVGTSGVDVQFIAGNAG